jgi:preprotein translocase subunit SecG
MQMILFVVQIILALLLIGSVLIQRTSTDGLSGLGSGGAGKGLISSEASTSFMTKLTAILAALFMLNSLLLANIAHRAHHQSSIIESMEAAPTTPASHTPDHTPAMPEAAVK